MSYRLQEIQIFKDMNTFTKFTFILFFTSCSASNYDCLTLAQNYKEVLENKYSKTSVESWEQMERAHENIIQNLIKNWPQTSQNLNNFSDLFYSLLRTRVWLACNEKLKDPPHPTKNEVKKGVFKLISKESEFSLCLTKQWIQAHNFISQSCRLHFN